MYIELTDRQQEALDKCKKSRAFGVFFDMGTGKTAIMLSLIDYLVFEKLEVKSVLIIAPASVIKRSRVWQREMEKWQNFAFFDYVELIGNSGERKKAKKQGYTIHLLSNALVEWYYHTYGNLDDYDMIIIDESSTFKSATTVRWKALSKMITTNHRVYLLTGTPMPQSHADLWSQIYLLDGGARLENSFYRFRNKYGYKVNRFKYVYPKSSQKTIEKLIDDICMFDENIKDLPPKREHKIMLNFTNEKQKIFNEFKNSYILELQKGDITVVAKTALVNKCLQLANGNVYVDSKGSYEIFDDTKWQWCYNFILHNPNRNILIFYNFKSDKEQLLKLPNAKAIETARDVELWDEGKIAVGIISPFSFQYGGNFQYGGHTVIWYGLIWSLENFLQANRRVWRRGQVNTVDIIYLLMDNTFDNDVYKTLVKKENTQRQFLESIKL